MRGPRARSRAALACAYVAAMVWAQAAHDHGPRAQAGLPAPGSVSADRSIANWSGGQSASTTAHAQADCAACQFRATHHAGALPEARASRIFIQPAAEYAVVALASAAATSHSCRAPPLV